MRWLFGFIVIGHGLIHLLGTSKAFGWSNPPQLSRAISRGMGVVWLLAALLVIFAVVALFAWPRHAYIWALAAAVLSQVAIVSVWQDAKFGTLANVLLLFAALHGYLTQGPHSLRASYEGDVGRALAVHPDSALLSDADLAHLPAPVQRYVRLTGFVGRPKVNTYRLRFEGRIRGAPEKRWMPFEAEQVSLVEPQTRLFFMRASLFGLPVEALHRLHGPRATMRVKALGAMTLVNASGADMDRSEAVTQLNDLCILAPGALITPRMRWQPIDAQSARVHFTSGTNTVSATLLFDAEGLLRDFVSDDRSAASADGKTFTKRRFSTPVRDYRQFGAHRLASFGEARWHLPEGPFVYGEFRILEIDYEQNRQSP